ncbi:hypothetical protein BC833DRAFT_588835 [Globomyces pollinis-pini]|nr:hypothetical protein BC833DRAFT_588835 [Globomyces pollinis-pini]KAJ3000884.1 hypothetical protein HDV02_002347 [Globomyces sp. JEL0801]
MSFFTRSSRIANQFSRKYSTGASSGISSKIAGIVDPIAYYARVSISFLGQVAKNSKITTLPDVGQATQGISSFIAGFSSGAWRKVTVSQAVEFLGEGVKIGGFFLAGEMIGRGSIVGYKIEGAGHGDHH